MVGKAEFTDLLDPLATALKVPLVPDLGQRRHRLLHRIVSLHLPDLGGRKMRALAIEPVMGVNARFAPPAARARARVKRLCPRALVLRKASPRLIAEIGFLSFHGGALCPLQRPVHAGNDGLERGHHDVLVDAGAKRPASQLSSFWLIVQLQNLRPLHGRDRLGAAVIVAEFNECRITVQELDYGSYLATRQVALRHIRQKCHNIMQ